MTLLGIALWYSIFVLRSHTFATMKFQILESFIPRASSLLLLLLVNGSIVHSSWSVVSSLHGYGDVMMMRQMPLQTNVLRVLVWTQVTGKSSLTAAFETHVPRQIMLQRIFLPAGGALQILIFDTLALCVYSKSAYLRKCSSIVNHERSLCRLVEALAKTWKTPFICRLVYYSGNEERTLCCILIFFSCFYVIIYSRAIPVFQPISWEWSVWKIALCSYMNIPSRKSLMNTVWTCTMRRIIFTVPQLFLNTDK